MQSYTGVLNAPKSEGGFQVSGTEMDTVSKELLTINGKYYGTCSSRHQ